MKRGKENMKRKKTWLAGKTKIVKNTSKYEKLVEFLSYLSFDSGDQKPKNGKQLKVIISGSFPASLARSIAK